MDIVRTGSTPLDRRSGCAGRVAADRVTTRMPTSISPLVRRESGSAQPEHAVPDRSGGSGPHRPVSAGHPAPDGRVVGRSNRWQRTERRSALSLCRPGGPRAATGRVQPSWYPEKTYSAIAEATAILAAGALLALRQAGGLHPTDRVRATTGDLPDCLENTDTKDL